MANARGFERAIAAGATDIEAVISVSEAYNQKNAHRTVQKSMDEISWMAQQDVGTHFTISIGLANCYHCVFEGRIQESAVFALVDELHNWGIREVALSDTTGYATPEQVYELSRHAIETFPDIQFGAHLHDTRGRGLANSMAALSSGIRWFDVALAGLGGSPFAPGMGGNLSLETFVDCVEAMGIPTGIKMEKLSSVVDSVSRICADLCRMRPEYWDGSARQPPSPPARSDAARSASCAKDSGRTFTATSRPSRESRTRYTSPIPPAPSGASTS